MNLAPPRVFLTTPGPLDPWTLAPPPGPARPIDDVLAELDAARGGRFVILLGHDPLALPHLPALLAACRARGLAPGLQLTLRPGDLDRLRGLDVEIVRLGLHGDDHDARVGTPGSRAETLAALQQRRPRARVVTAVDGDGALSAVTDARDRAEEIELIAAVPLPHAARAALLDRVWLRLRGSATTVLIDGLDHAPFPDDPEARPLDPLLVDLRLQGGWLHTRARPTPLRADLRLSEPIARHDLPPLDGPTLLLAPGLGDVLLATSTLPALARALQRRGLPLRFDSVWEPPWNLHTGDDPVRAAARMSTARRFDGPFLDHADLRGAKHVIVPGWDAAARLVARLPPDATMHVLDLHMLVGVERLLAAWPAADWGDRVVVHACFPGFAPMYLRAGVPYHAVAQRPDPIDTATVRPGPGDGAPVCAGNHLRDHRLLTAALDHLGDRAPVLDHFSASPANHRALRPRGAVALAILYEALQRAPYVVLPVGWSTTFAAGQSLTMLARAAGRPIVGTRVWGLIDHLREGVDALLVPPEDPRALAEAIDRLAHDGALRDQLAVADAPGVEGLAEGMMVGAVGAVGAWAC